jgi:uncharacterized membrane protein
MDYVTLKYVHVLSSTLLFGTGLGSAYYMFTTNLDGDPRAIAVVTRRVVLADWLFTTPTAVIQPATGVYLAVMAGVPWTAPWLAWSIGLYALAAGCWLPVVVIQIRMARIAHDAVRGNGVLPPRYWRYHRIWTALGIPAFLAFLVIFYLMVAKPG